MDNDYHESLHGEWYTIVMLMGINDYWQISNHCNCSYFFILVLRRKELKDSASFVFVDIS